MGEQHQVRLPLPAAYVDPAFAACLVEAVGTQELVDQFCRLYGSNLNNEKRTEEDMRAFAEFAHDAIYMRLSDEAIHSLRAAALVAASS